MLHRCLSIITGRVTHIGRKFALDFAINSERQVSAEHVWDGTITFSFSFSLNSNLRDPLTCYPAVNGGTAVDIIAALMPRLNSAEDDNGTQRLVILYRSINNSLYVRNNSSRKGFPRGGSARCPSFNPSRALRKPRSLDLYEPTLANNAQAKSSVRVSRRINIYILIIFIIAHI